MRAIILTFAPVILSATVIAQGVFSNKTQSILEKVIQDYPNHFYNIKGEVIGQTHLGTEYRSTIQLPGASSCKIILSSATSNMGYNWTCSVFETENFEQAKAHFRDIYTQLRNSIITAGGQKTFILSGQYETPSMDRQDTRILFSLLPAVGEVKKLKVELLLRHEDGKKWKVTLSVNDQDLKEAEVQREVTVN